MKEYNIVSMDNQDTVVAEYISCERREESYQTEAQLEQDFIDRLVSQGYEYISVTDEAGMVSNLRAQIERLNDCKFYDSEWKRFCDEYLIKANDGIVEKTRKIQVDSRHSFRLDNGLTKNIKIIDKQHIHNNHLQVLNQYETTGGTRANRYDVTVLVNGLPLIHIELKRRGVAIREAFNQISRYQRESFWAASGLFEYVQLFVISNGTQTKYYSNTTRNQHINEVNGSARKSKKKTSNSFEFTSFWADAKNKTIDDLVDFTKTFFAKHTILNILTRYCVFTAEELLLVMRPYQIAATERILNRIEVANNYKKYGTIEGGGFIWHTTGSGKTLTSFKAAQLATALHFIDKVLFVVDRKDLDYQTMREYDRFEKGAANSNTSTNVLKKQLEDPNTKIIITTIQKLGVFIARSKSHEIFSKHVVMIFDECHRSQFGKMHQAITKEFNKYHIFGFTGTPIFSKNAGTSYKTTAQVFGGEGEKKDKALHAYTIVDAINDKNVLPFRIDYISTVKSREEMQDKQVQDIDTKGAMEAPARIEEIVRYTLEHFNQKTKRQEYYTHKIVTNVSEVAGKKQGKVEEEKEQRRISGFNSIFAASSISAACKYYSEFKRQVELSGQKLKIAMIYSYAANEEEADEEFDNDKLDKTHREFLESAIADYNATFSTNYDISNDKFQNYYKDLSLRVKNREVDLLIVVNMFLTGFDATTMNTLWVDKNLQHHGLIQAFSRTNRILNSVKIFGNIICFRNLKEATDSALSLFGDREAGGIVLLKTYDNYYNGYEQNGKYKAGYKELIERLIEDYPLGVTLFGELSKKAFIALFGAILQLQNILTAFDDFKGNEILSERDFQDYQGLYLDLYNEFRTRENVDKENINDDVVFEIELIKQIEVNIDYILMLVAKYCENNRTDKDILIAIDKAVNSSLELRSKKDLIEGFISRVNTVEQMDDDWRQFVEEQKEIDLVSLITDENLKEDETRRFIDNSFRDGALKTTGTDIDKILPPVSRFGGSNRHEKKQVVITKLLGFFEKYFGLV